MVKALIVGSRGGELRKIPAKKTVSWALLGFISYEFMSDLVSDFFMLLFTGGQFVNLAQNTNAYAMVKKAGRDGSRKWYAAQAGEMMIFVGLIIYMGLYHSSTIPDYWRKDGLALLHR